MSPKSKKSKAFTAHLIKSGKMHPTKGFRQVGYNKTKEDRLEKGRQFQDRFWSRIGIRVTA
jgi:hypothetical protein